MVARGRGQLKAGILVPGKVNPAPADRSVLVISYLYPPVGGGGVQRALKLSRYLPEYGWRPLVVAVEGSPPGQPRDPQLLEEIPGESVVCRVPEPPTARWLFSRARSAAGPSPGCGSNSPGPGRLRTGLRRTLGSLRDHVLAPDEQVLWVSGAAGAGMELVRKYHPAAILSTSGPASNHLVAERIHRRTGLPWIADFRDPWVDNMHWNRLPPRRRARESRMEASVAAAASAFTAVTRAFCDQLSQRYPGLPVGLIYNGFDPADYRDLPTADSCPDGAVTLVYAGALYPKRSPEAIFRALRNLIDRGQLSPGTIRIVFAGIFDYPGRSENADLVRRLDLEDCIYPVGSLSHRAVLDLMARADGLLLVGDEDPSAGDYIPGKIYEYLALDKPMVGSQARGEARDILESTGNAFLCDPGEVEDMEERLLAFLSDASDAGRHTPDLSPYRRDLQAAQMGWMLDRISG